MSAESVQESEFDVVIVGAGFAGMYMLHRLRGMGLTARVFEQGDGVGGTWYWNRYPGARCDAESLAYSYSFDAELEQQWQWSERYATQPEILRYAEHVADRHDLYRDIRFEQTVTSAAFDQESGRWRVSTADGLEATGCFLVMATGCLSVPQLPDIAGLDSFSGNRYQASLWPRNGVDFSGQRVGVIGTGSSAIQAIPVIAQQAAHLSVFQRSPNFSVPAHNGKLDQDWVDAFKKNYREHRDFHKRALSSGFGDLEIEPRDRTPQHESGHELSEAEFDALCEEYWQTGGARFMSVVGDALSDEQINARVARFVHNKIRQLVDDSKTADALCPTDHPIGTKRICVDTGYYETYNRTNVALVNLRETPIERITSTGVQLSDRHVELDTLVLATGFDAMTGAMKNIDVRNGAGLRLNEAWSEGPKAYLGLMPAGFDNLFLITGPGSPSVLSNMLVSIEQHVDFIADVLEYMGERQSQRISADPDAQEQWVAHVNEVANETLFPKGGSWYLGANVPGKPRVFMPYAGGVGVYREVCDDVANNDYRGFKFA
ncbi:MAG: NAD(P)/FAD-dependent oxidoreductase [Pseudomonadaceae bacterium]|nr:NAD(P)/FAD-dependent oxidoreductase [Pseudomonadaceae bacterium]